MWRKSSIEMLLSTGTDLARREGLLGVCVGGSGYPETLRMIRSTFQILRWDNLYLRGGFRKEDIERRTHVHGEARAGAAHLILIWWQAALN